MRKKMIGIFVCMLLMTTCVVPVMGELTTSKKNGNDTNRLSSGSTNLKFMIAGNNLRVFRSYWLHVPPSYDGSKPIPLVIVFRTEPLFFYFNSYIYYLLSYSLICRMEKYTEFSQKADEKGFIVVYPNAKLLLNPFFENLLIFPGFLYDWGYFHCWNSKFVDDVGFIRDLIDKMKQDYKINSSRIYATGLSDGAYLTYSIGAYLSDTVAAIAPVAGAIGVGVNKTMYYIPTPKNPVSVIVFHGTNDSSDVPYNGNDNSPSANESVAFWMTHNKCDPIPEIYTKGKIIRRTYTNGENRTEVVFYTTVGGEHVWPGNPYYDPINEISATDLMWEFFESHPKQ